MRIHKRIVLGFYLIGVALPGAAQQSDKGKSFKKFELEEVIVSAQKREESLQDTPIALNAFGEMDLEQQGIVNVGDLATTVPALTIEPFPINTSTLRIYIRGVGSIDAQITQDPAVGVYMDGVYIARSSGLATDVADLARIEVLRGPQGTLYGRNSTGGAVNLITKRPSVDELEFAQHLTIGNNNLFTSKTSLNVPLWRGAGAKFAYYLRDVDGWMATNHAGAKDFDARETEGWRADFGWDINANWRMDYSFDRSDVVSYNLGYAPAFPSVPIPTGDAFADTLSQQIAIGARPLVTYYGKDRPDTLPTPLPPIPSSTIIEGHALNLVWSRSEDFELKYLYAQRELFDSSANDLAGGISSTGYRLDRNKQVSFDASGPSATAPDTLLTVDALTSALGAIGGGGLGRSVFYNAAPYIVEQEQSSHELQFSGNLLEGGLEYIAGLYYFEETGSEITVFGHQLGAPLGNTGLRLEALSEQNVPIGNSATAIFSQWTWRPPILDERLALTLGARHSVDSRKSRMFRRTVAFAVLPGEGNAQTVSPNDRAVEVSDDSVSATADNEYDDDSFAFIAEFEVSEEINLYFKAVEAYRSGGSGMREPIAGAYGGAASERRFAEGYEEEKAFALELGIKAQLFDNRVRINADVFDTTISDKQVTFSVPGTLTDSVVANAGQGKLTGAEMDLTLLATRNLMLNLNYAYLETELDAAVNPLTGVLEDGFVEPSAPRHAYTFGVDWTLLEADLGRLILNAAYSFTDERNGGAVRQFATRQFDRQDDFALVSGRIGFYGLPVLDGNLTIALWGKNLTDEEYTVNSVHQFPHASRASIWGAPRSYGLDLIYRYNN